ncbi:hypothetical protein HIM_06097 [Hirsutella minnesotensis 3608]|uniref:CS domain-containing protein n=1 Tax=Hirsutella minnesotensis 3608 TaxID=1043627 RepID=A0A0F7ZJK7_9HYPO|nr:hypothetical protein HIM_06097 [Hirsutella minnesotensis 3608]
MSHLKLAEAGLKAVEARNWNEALAKLSDALRFSHSPAWLMGRSKALIGLERFDEALDDANLAWHMAYDRGNRDLLITANYRRAVAYYRLGQYANADCCCIYAMRLVKGFSVIEQEDPKLKHLDSDGLWTQTYQDALKEAQNGMYHDGFQDAETHQDRIDAFLDSKRDKAPEWQLASNLRIQALRSMEKLPSDDEARKATVQVKPERKQLAHPEPSGAPKPTQDPKAVDNKSMAHPFDLVRPNVQHYQTSTVVSVCIFTKDVDKEQLKVEFTPTTVRLNPIRYPTGAQEELDFCLWGEIDPEASKFLVTKSKVELTLQKKTPGRWQALEKPDGDADERKIQETEAMECMLAPPSKIPEESLTLQQRRQPLQTAKDSCPKLDPDYSQMLPELAIDKPGGLSTQEVPHHPTDPSTGNVPAGPSRHSPEESPSATNALSVKAAPGPSYPTSSRSGPKDWDKIGAELDEEDDSAGDVNVFFKSLYKNATADQRRAMMKSFTESNGTSLSTDWNDVRGRKVETMPPEGVEAKKWE